MELRRFLSVVLKRIWLILLATALVTGMTFVLSILSTPVYQSTTTLLINQGADPLNDPYSSVLTSQRVASTYVEQIKSPVILNQVIHDLNLPFSVGALGGMMTVQQVRDTQLIQVSVEDTNPERAQAIANQIVQAFIDQDSAKQQTRFQSAQRDLDQQVAGVRQKIDDTQKALAPLGNPSDPKSLSAPEFVRTEQMRLQLELSTYQVQYTILLKSAQDFRLASSRYADMITVFSPAELPQVPIKPRTALNTLLGLISGLVLGVSTAFLLEYLDDTVKSSEDVTRVLGLNTLGAVARLPQVVDLRDGLVTAENVRSPYAEAYRSLRTNLQFSNLAKPTTTLVVTSAGPAEGKSTTLANVGVAMAQSGKRVILVDTDLRRPSLHKFFGLPQEPGVTNLLLGEVGELDAVLRETTVPGLRVLVSGTRPPNPAELLTTSLMGNLVEALRRQADIVLFDSPPVLAVTDATLLAAKTDGVLWVVDAGTTRTDVLRRAKEALAQVDAKILGVVLNRLSAEHGYGYNYYYYYSDDGHRQKRHGRSGKFAGSTAMPATPRLPDRVSKGLPHAQAPSHGPEEVI